MPQTVNVHHLLLLPCVGLPALAFDADTSAWCSFRLRPIARGPAAVVIRWYTDLDNDGDATWIATVTALPTIE
jgi:hypothetical protein